MASQKSVCAARRVGDSARVARYKRDVTVIPIRIREWTGKETNSSSICDWAIGHTTDRTEVCKSMQSGNPFDIFEH